MPPRHRFLEPIHNVKEGANPPHPPANRRNSDLHLWKFGGAYRDRTDDLKLAKLALSQLSYGPDQQMVGREGVEPSTSRLSGVRSNHLSYRPPAMPGRRISRGRRGPAQAYISCEMISRMKGHEDGGIVLWTGGSSSGDERRRFPP